MDHLLDYEYIDKMGTMQPEKVDKAIDWLQKLVFKLRQLTMPLHVSCLLPLVQLGTKGSFCARIISSVTKH